VVVSAGAIHSPAILLRSGIGIDDELPVGRNLKDHAATPGFEIALRPEGRAHSADAPVFGSLLRYSSGMFDAGPNDMQMLWFDAVGPDEDGLSGGRLIGAVMRVFSSGEVRLRSSDATVDPVVEFRLLSDDRDRARLVDCVHRMIDVVTAEPVARIAASVTALDTPIGDLRSDAAIDAWISRTVNDYVHAVGTCRMGTPGDPAAVVDCNCAVIGFEQLLVCDASVMPDIPRANTHLTTVAIADALVDRLLSASSSA
jgi:choline dehydrogenase-like flavoprotein